MFKRLAVFATAFLFSATAFAGNLEDGIYKSNVGYTITPPEGWFKLDGSNALGLKGHLPQNLSADSVKRLDVIFFPATGKCDPSLKGDNARIDSNNKKLKANKRTPESELEKPAHEYSEEMPEFVSTISVMVLNHAFSDENLEKDRMANALKEALIDVRSDSSKIKGFSPSVERTDDGFSSKASFSLGKRKLKSEQFITLKSDRTYIVTCTYDPAQSDDKTAFVTNGLCKKTARTLKVSK